MTLPTTKTWTPRPLLAPLGWLALTVGFTACKAGGCGSSSATSDGGASAATTASDSASNAAAAATPALPPSIPRAEQATARVRPGLRACFVQQIRRNPSTTKGTVVFAFEVGVDGHVTAAKVKSRAGLDDETIACMTDRAREAVFEKPLDNAPATVNAPFTFVSMGDAGSGSSTGAPAPFPSGWPRQ